MPLGKVYLVGAGPGDPDLITVKGLRLIRIADVIVYDRLIPFELLKEVRSDAECVNAGKAPEGHGLSQKEINQILVDCALRGKFVVRLKGGDPFVFGRGGEEALVCRQYGIPFEVVPGISSAYAVPAYAGIPLTHRRVSRSFTVITGHEDPAKPGDGLNYDALAQSGNTIVILMGARTLPQITRRLMDAGLDPNTPAATIEWGTTINQRVVEGALGTIAGLSIKDNITSPAITVIGDVVGLRGQGVAWFEEFGEMADQVGV